MQQNKADIIDRGWESMHEILEREMPQKERNRGLLFWLTGLSLGLVLIGSIIMFAINSSESKSSLADNTSIENHSENQNINDSRNEKLSTKTPNENKINTEQNQDSKSNQLTENTVSPISNTQDNHIVSVSNSTASQNQSTSVFKSATQTQVTSNTLSSGAEAKQKDLDQISKTALTNALTNPRNLPRSSTDQNNQEPILNSTLPISTNTTINTRTNTTTNTTTRTLNSSTRKSPLFDTKTKTLDLISLIPVKPYALQLPEGQTLAMTLALATIIKPEIYDKRSFIDLGATAIYAQNATGSGIEAFIGIRRELSPTVSILFQTGIGLLNLNNPPNSADLNLNSSISEDAPQDPAGPAGPQGPGGAPPIDAPQGGANDEEGIETFGEPDLELTNDQLKTLSLSNLDEFVYATAKIGAQWSPRNSRFQIGSNIGLDYILDLNFNQLYIVDNALAFDNTRTNNLTVVDLGQDASILPFAEMRTSYSISKLITIDLLYKTYFKSIFPTKDRNLLNQFKLGVHLSLPMKNK